MALRALLRSHRISIPRSRCKKAFTTIAEGDSVLLRDKKDESKTPIFIKALETGQTLRTQFGRVKHDDIIGLRARAVAVTDKKHELRVLVPTLEEYVTTTPRNVTPVYPADANLIVSLLDLHVSPPESVVEDPAATEILEAGTGHGSLSLYLSRALHAANPSLPPRLRNELLDYHLAQTAEVTQSVGTESGVREDGLQTSPELKNWLASRKAVLHTIDVVPMHSRAAVRTIHGFRRGTYAGNIDFYTGDVSQWITERHFTGRPSTTPEDRSGEEKNKEQPSPFLSHAILDLPESDKHLATVARALRPDGTLVIFNPSISQIQDCVSIVRTRKLPLILDRVLELGASWTSGREWDVRAVRTRKALRVAGRLRMAAGDGGAGAEGKSKAAPGMPAGGGEGGGEAGAAAEVDADQAAAEAVEAAGNAKDDDSGWQMITRPKVGVRVTGGGFVGVWRKMQHREPVKARQAAAAASAEVIAEGEPVQAAQLLSVIGSKDPFECFDVDGLKTIRSTEAPTDK